MTCSSLLMGFVKRTFKDSHASLVEKLVERAHILESNFANERLTALRNVDPGERMAIGDIFIAPPPDYQAPGHVSTSHRDSPQPSPLPLDPTQTRPAELYFPPAHATHSRPRSDPIASPGFSSASTAVSETDRPPTPPKDTTSPLKFAFVDQTATAPSSAPASNNYLLPSTTYNSNISSTTHGGGLSTPGLIDRPISLYPGGPQTAHRRNQSSVSVYPPHVSYTPEERSILFAFSNESPFDTHSNSESARSSNQNLLDEIDDAIDQVFAYGATPREGKKGQDLVLLPSTTYNPKQHARKDSVMPASNDWSLKDLPPLPMETR